MRLEQDIDPIRTRRLELVGITAPFLDAVIAGDPSAASLQLGAIVGRWLAADAHHLVRLGLASRAAAAAGSPGLARVIVLPGATDRRAIGSVGAHGLPDQRGQLEVGCRIHPAYRRRGYGAEAMTGFVEWASARLGVTRFLLAVPSPRDAEGLMAIDIESPGAAGSADAIAGLAALVEGERRR